MLGGIRGGLAVDQIVDTEHREVALQLLLLRRAGQDDAQPFALHPLYRLAHTGQHALARLVLPDEEDQHVAALADLRVDLVGREFLAAAPERLAPRFDVQVVGVDQRAVDIEQDRLEGHAATRCKRRTRL